MIVFRIIHFFTIKQTKQEKKEEVLHNNTYITYHHPLQQQS